MYIIIVGAGEVGNYLARILVEEHHDVAIVDHDENLARGLEAQLDALVIHGSGVNPEALRRAGIAKADLVLAVTHSDEVNLIACMTAKKLRSKTQTVARVRESLYLADESSMNAKDLGLDLLVGPERAVASEVVSILGYEGAGEVHYLADGRIALLELPLSTDSPLVHETLAELRDVFPSPSLIAAIAGPNGLRIPRGDDRMAADERAYVLTVPGNSDEFWILSGRPWHHVRHTLIVGCGRIGFHLARQLEGQKMFPTIIEKDRKRAEWVATRLTKSIVLQGDATDPDFIREQLEERADAVVVLLEDDEKAIIVSLFTKQLGAKKVMCRVDKPAYWHIAHTLGIDALLSPKRAVAHEILRFVRRGSIHAAHMLGDHEGEILEMRVPDEPKNARIIGTPLKDLRFPDGALLGAIVKDDGIVIATGDTVLSAGDDLLVISLPGTIPAIEKLLA
jgi:trk system potassium uptake protein TrkA